MDLALLIVGLLLGGVINTTVTRYASFKESQGVAAAIRAELSGLLRMIEFREFLSRLRERIARLEQPDYSPETKDILASTMGKQNYSSAFDALLPKLGLLGPLSSKVVQVYNLQKALLEDFGNLQDALRAAVKGHPIHRGDLLFFSRHLEKLIGLIMTEGRAAVTLLEAYERRSWLAHCLRRGQR